MNNFVEIKNVKQEARNQLRVELEDYKRDLVKVNKENNDELVRYYTEIINRNLTKIDEIENEINYMRDNDKEDLELRKRIKQDYSKLIKETIPDYAYVGFFGINSMSKIKELIETGIINQSEINITYKDNIRISLEDADNSITSYLPYGAIFAFMPDDVEERKQRVDDRKINLKESKDKLYAIITTPENIERIQNWCLKSKISINKVLTHKDFLKKSENLFKEQIYKHGKM